MRLPPVLGVAFGVAVALGGMIGAGILRAPHDVARLLPTPAFFLGVWVLGGAYALLGANAVAELATMNPQSGGQQVFARQAFGPFAGFVVGWNDWLSTCASVAVIAFVFADTLVALLGADVARTGAIALAAVAMTLLLVWRGARSADLTQQVTSVAKALAFLVLVVACLVYAATNDPGLGASPPLPVGSALLGAFVISLQGVIFAFDGWVGVAYFAEEVPDPSRQIPRALLGGVVAVLIVYLLVNGAIMLVVPMDVIASDPLPAAAASRVVFGDIGGTVVQLLVVVALPSAIVANTLVGSRVAFGLGREVYPLRRLARTSRQGVPHTALVVTALMTGVFVWSGTFERVLALCALLFVASYGVSFAAVFVLRRRRPQAERPWRAWGHPWTTGLVLTGSAGFVVGTIVAAPRDSAIAAALVALAWPVYRLTTSGPSGAGEG